MNKQMKQWQALAYVIGGLGLVLMLTIFPLRLWQETIVSTSNRQVAGATDKITQDIYSNQMFVAQYDHLEGISISVASASEDATFILRVFDEHYGLLREQEHTTAEMEQIPGECYVMLNLDTEVGKQYYYTLQCIQGELTSYYEVTETSDFIYHGPCYIGDQALGGCNMITTYHYEQSLRKTKMLLAMAGIFGVVLLFSGGLYLMNAKKGKLDQTVTLQWGMKKLCNPLIVLFTIGGMVATGPFYLFSWQYFDIGVFTLGVLLLGCTLWYGVNRTYPGEHRQKDWKKDGKALLQKMPDYLQAFCFAMCLLACVHYMNGLYNIYHDIAYRELLFWLAMAVLVTFQKKELLALWNIPGVIAGTIWAVQYYQAHLPECLDEQGVLREPELQVLKLTCYLAVPIVLIGLRTLVVLVKGMIGGTKRLGKKDYPTLPLTGGFWLGLGYVLLTIVLSVCVIQHRNTRGWPIYTVAVFGVYALQMFLWKNKSHLLQNLMNGIIYHFIGCTYYCLLHRPFMSFLYTRYAHIFHTVTVTATYLSIVMVVAIVKLFFRYNREKNWRACYFELILFGIVANYQLFTMSRTGLLAVAVAGVILWLLMLQGKFLEKLKKLSMGVCLVVFSVLWFFPITFSAQRILPTLVNQPKECAEAEEFSEPIMVGNDWRSDDYITLDRFVEIFANKMFSVPEDTINLYQYRVGGMPEDMLEGKCTPEYEVLPIKFASNEIHLPANMLLLEDGAEEDYTNGRGDIFRAYYGELTPEGHEKMSTTLPNGESIIHAHNIYLQFAYDHGIIVGILFIVWLVYTLVLAIALYVKKGKEKDVFVLPLALMMILMVGGVVEWISHPCNPVGFVCLCMLPALIKLGHPTDATDGYEEREKSI